VGRRLIPFNSRKETRSKTILVVDDEPFLTNMLSRFLQENNYITMTAENGQEAWEKYLKSKPDLVLTGIFMPVMNGFELSQRIKHNNASMPIIAMAGYDLPSVRMRVRKIGVEVFLGKPFHLRHVLLPCINGLLGT